MPRNRSLTLDTLADTLADTIAQARMVCLVVCGLAYAHLAVALWGGTFAATTPQPILMAMGLAISASIAGLACHRWLRSEQARRNTKAVRSPLAGVLSVLGIALLEWVMIASSATLLAPLTPTRLVIGLLAMTLPVHQAYVLGQHRLGHCLFMLWGMISGAGLLSVLFHATIGESLSTLGYFIVLTVVGFWWVNTHAQQQYWTLQSLTALQSLAALDALTQLPNRGQFNRHLHLEFARARRHNHPVCLALLDLDHFKRLNDTYGHPVGDRVLEAFSQLIQRTIRESDIPARYGGEEFALILPDTSLAAAQELLERLRRQVAEHVFCLPDTPLTVTMSSGVAQLTPQIPDAMAWVAHADEALYAAKHQGRNRVVAAARWGALTGTLSPLATSSIPTPTSTQPEPALPDFLQTGRRTASPSPDALSTAS